MKVEVGKKYFNGNDEVVEIIDKMLNPIFGWDVYVGMKRLRNGFKAMIPLDEHGRFMENDDDPLTLVREA